MKALTMGRGGWGRGWKRALAGAGATALALSLPLGLGALPALADEDTGGTEAPSDGPSTDPSSDPSGGPGDGETEAPEPGTDDCVKPGEDEFPEGIKDSAGEAGFCKVTNAMFNWGVNKESGAGAFDGSSNFLVAGQVGDAGSRVGFSENFDKFYKSEDGNVKIMKPDADGKLIQADKDNYDKTPDGEKVSTRGDKLVSLNEVQITGGTGAVNPETDTGEIQWKGSFTISYYKGMTYWTIKDPKLSVKDGHGKITATFEGFGSDMDDASKWEPLPAEENHTVADFKNAKVDLQQDGFEVVPDYLGVKVSTPEEDQLRSGDNWGSFPQDWVDWNIKTGQSSYWYTSYGQADVRKPTMPVKVCYLDVSKCGEPTSPPTTSPEPKPSEDAPAGKDKGDDEGQKPAGETTSSPTMFWAINHESSSGAYAPGTCNFLVAGKSGDHGKADVWAYDKKLFKGTDGNVTAEKPDSSGKYHPITWNDRCKDRNGKTLSTGKNSYSEARVKIENGAYSDADGGMTIKWDGSFTIVYYSGMTYWSLSNPELKVTKNGKGEMTGTASGFGADMDNLDKWDKLPAKKITMLTFSGLDVAKAKADGGFTVNPDYEGLKAGGGRNDQDRSQPGWGSFPKSWIDYNILTGQSSYWYHSRSQRNPYKKAAPLTVALSGDFKAPTPEKEPSGSTGPDNSGGPAGGTADQNPGGPAGPGDDAEGSEAAQSVAQNDQSAFSQVAQHEAAKAEVSNPITAEQWTIGGIATGGAVAASITAGFLLRRRIGLDPASWM